MNAEKSPSPSEIAEEKGKRRGTILIDRSFQLRQVNHGISLFMVLIFLQLVIFLTIGCLWSRGVMDNYTAQISFVAVAVGVPVVMCMFYSWLSIKNTHRVAGAAYRLSQDLNNIIHDPSFRFHLRKDDYLQELAIELNNVMEHLEERRDALEEAVESLAQLREEIGELSADLPEEKKINLHNNVRQITEKVHIIRFGNHKAKDGNEIGNG